MAEEENKDEVDLGQKLEKLVEEIKEVMERRKERIAELRAEMKKQPKFIRTVRHNKHPVLMNPSYGEKFNEYKLIGSSKLEERANIIKNSKDFAEKVSAIKKMEIESQDGNIQTTKLLIIH